MPRSQIAAASEVLSEETDGIPIDYSIRLIREDDGSEILDLGGIWDRKHQAWVDADPETCVEWTIQPAQYGAADWFAGWIPHYVSETPLAERPAPYTDVVTCLGIGGRGGGKSDWGVRLGIMMAIAKPGRRCIMSSPTESETEELQSVVETIIPPSWFRWRKSELRYEFWNGSRIQMLSGHVPRAFKRGRIDFLFWNEGQDMSKNVYLKGRPRLGDTAGLGYIAANPPDTAKGMWILDMWERAQAGKVPGVVVQEFDNTLNTRIDRRAMEVLRHEFGEADYDREIGGKMIPPGEFVFYGWNSLMGESVRDAPELGRITEEFTRKMFRRPFASLIGMDFQKTPHMAAIVLDLYANPDDPDDPFSWYTDEVVIERADEDDLIDELEGRGYHGDECGLIVDASAWWQDGAHSEKNMGKGKGSVSMLRRREWRNVFRPDRKAKGNPLVTERCQAANARFRTKSGHRRAFSVPTNILLNRALQRWPNGTNGEPKKTSSFAHICDAATYLIWRLWPRKTKRHRLRYEGGQMNRGSRGRDLDGL